MGRYAFEEGFASYPTLGVSCTTWVLHLKTQPSFLLHHKVGLTGFSLVTAFHLILTSRGDHVSIQLNAFRPRFWALGNLGVLRVGCLAAEEEKSGAHSLITAPG